VKTRATLIRPRVKGLSVRRQCALLSVHRSRLYYKPVGEKPENIKIMQIMDKHLLDHPTEGVISLVYFLIAKEFPVGPKRIRRLLRLMGRETLYRRKNLTRQGLKQFIKPYLLRGLVIDRPNQVWSTDITYIPMKKGFMYLTAVIDVYSRKIVAWGLSNSLTAEWCKTVLQEAIATFGKPEIINSDQGAQYTSALWTQYLEDQKIQISMDGKGRATDNIWIERFWKSLKYDYVYLNPADDGFELYQGIDEYMAYYNEKIHHTTRQSPNQRYQEPVQKAA
jgi:putative transposase